MNMPPKKIACATADHSSEPRQFSRSRKMLAVAAIFLQWLGDDADVSDACLLHRIHERGKSAEGNIFVSTQINGLTLGVANLRPQARGNLVDVDGIVAQINSLLPVNAQHQPLFGDFFYRPRLG